MSMQLYNFDFNTNQFLRVYLSGNVHGRDNNADTQSQAAFVLELNKGTSEHGNSFGAVFACSDKEPH